MSSLDIVDVIILAGNLYNDVLRGTSIRLIWREHAILNVIKQNQFQLYYKATCSYDLHVTHAYRHTHTHIYIYVYVCVGIYVCAKMSDKEQKPEI